MSEFSKRTLGKTGLEVSVLGFGAAPVAFLKEDRDKAEKMIRFLLDRGVNLIDTATAYPGSHSFLGDTIMDRRDEFVLVSKIGSSAGGLERHSAERMTKEIEKALSEMKVDHVDVMLLHSAGLEVLEADEALGAMVEAREAGKVKFVGYSGDNDAAAFACRLPDVAVLETSVNIADQHNAREVLPLAGQHNVGVIAKRPIANAAWRDLSDQRGMYQKYAATYTERLSKMNLDPAAHGLDWAELALRWTLSQDLATAIVGTTNPDNAEKNLELAGKGPLDDSVRQAVAEAFTAAGGDRWEAQT